jgi:XTP/dITP diphosphohydrolase
MFLPAGLQQSFGEMAPEQKHAISHRARAFAQILASCFG